MKFLVLGEAPRGADLVAWIAEHPVHRLLPQAGDETPDAVVLAGGEETLVAEALSMLETGVPVIVVAGPELAAATVRRLGLVAEESAGRLVAWLPAVPRWEAYRESDPGLAASGPPELLQLDRVSSEPLEEVLFDDLALLTLLAGRFDQVSATLGPAASVSLGSTSGPPATWTLRPAEASGSARLVLGGHGEVDLEQAAGGPVAGEWTAIEELRGHISFDVLVDLVETLDAIRESARRRRTLDLHHEPTSERTIFKSQMTAIGCLLLLLTLLGLVALLVLGALLDPSSGTRAGRAAQVGFLFEDGEFQTVAGGEPQALTAVGRRHLDRIASQLDHVDASVVIAASGEPGRDAARVQRVKERLAAAGQPGAMSRVVVEPAPSGWVPGLLKIARIAWLAPLVLFLLLQLFLLAARPARKR